MPETTATKADNTPIFIPSPESERAEIDAKARKNRENRKLPVIPGDKVDFKALQDWLKLLTPEMTADNRVLIYVYRLDPLINNQLYDPKAYKYIDVISEDFATLDEKYFVKTHGGGTYKLTINDKCIPGDFQTVFSATLRMDMVEHPPKIANLNTVLWDHRKNKGYTTWAINNGLIGPDYMPIVPGRENGGVNSDQLVNAMKLVMDFTKQMTADQEKQLRKQLGADDQTSKGIQEIILERLRQDDPNKQISTVSQLVAAMKSLMPETQKSELSTVIPLFVQMMQQQNALLIELIRGNKESNNNNSNNSEGGEKRDEVSRLRDLIEIARELKGGSTNKNQVAEVIDSITPVLTPALQIVANVVALRAAQTGVVAPVIPQPTPQGKSVNRQDTIVHTPPPPQQPQLQPTQPQGVPPSMVIPEDEAVQMINQFKPIILNKLGREGWEFGAWIAEGFGDAVAASLVKYGVDGLLDAAKKVPDFWQHVNATYGEKYLREWLDSLVNYKKIMKKMEQEEDEEEEIEFKEE